MSHPPSSKMKTNDALKTAALPRTARPVWRSWWWFALAGLVLLGTPFLFSSPPDPELEARRRQIENLSAAERERLQRNFERFEKLPADRQAELRELDQAVQDDESLKNTLLEYERWLTTLSPWQRAELRKAPSNAEKLKLVQSIVAQQRRQAEDRRQQEQEIQEQIRINLARFQGPKPQGVVLTDEELGKMLAVLETHAPPDFHQSKTKPPGTPAYQMQLLAAVLEDRYFNQNEEAQEQPLPEPLIKDMIAQVSDAEARQQVQKLYDEKQSRGFVWYLAWKLNMAWWNEAREHYPSRAELDKTVETLGGKALEKFESEKEENPGLAYFHLIQATRQGEFDLDTRDLNDVLEKLGFRNFNRRPSGGSNGGRFGGRGGGPQRRDHGPERNGERGPRRPPDREPDGRPELPRPEPKDDPTPSQTGETETPRCD